MNVSLMERNKITCAIVNEVIAGIRLTNKKNGMLIGRRE